MARTVAGSPSRLGLIPHDVAAAVGQLHQLRRDQREEPVAQVGDELLGQAPGVTAAVDGDRQRGQRPPGVGGDEALDQVVERDLLRRHPTGRDHLVERGQRVPGRAAAHAEDGLDRIVGQLEAGVGRDPADVRLQLLGRQEVELEVLGPAPDGRADLLRIGRGQHEHHVGRRLLERLQQRGLRGPGEHVDLVEDVHLVAAGRRVRRPLDQLPDVVDAVVAGGVQLVDVEAGARFDGQAGGAVPHGSPSTGASQLRTLARMRADEVLPVPRGPLNR